MPTRIDDRYLWLGFGIFLFFAAQGIRHAITNTVRLTELEPIHSRKDDEEDQQPEDRIEISTLEILARSPNPNIAASAASLIVTRFAALPDAAEIISTDLQSEDEDTRRKARQAISYLQDWDTALSTSLDESRTFAAREALVQAARSLRPIHSSRSTIHLPTLDEMQSVANVAGGLVSLSDLEAEGERQRETRQLDVVSRLDELAEQAGHSEFGWRTHEEGPGSARLAGWDRIPSEMAWDEGGAWERRMRRNRDSGDAWSTRMRRRNREAVVVGVDVEDGEDVGGSSVGGGAGWRAMG